MERIEMVELVREKAGVGYTEAKQALEASNDDLLDALVWLESQGLAQTRTARSTTATPDASATSSEMRAAQSAYERASAIGLKAIIDSAVDVVKSIFAGLGRLLRAGMRNRFVGYTRRGEKVVVLPVLPALCAELLIAAAVWQLLNDIRHAWVIPTILYPLIILLPVVMAVYLLCCKVESPEQAAATAPIVPSGEKPVPPVAAKPQTAAVAPASEPVAEPVGEPAPVAETELATNPEPAAELEPEPVAETDSEPASDLAPVADPNPDPDPQEPSDD